MEGQQQTSGYWDRLLRILYIHKIIEKESTGNVLHPFAALGKSVNRRIAIDEWMYACTNEFTQSIPPRIVLGIGDLSVRSSRGQCFVHLCTERKQERTNVSNKNVQQRLNLWPVHEVNPILTFEGNDFSITVTPTTNQRATRIGYPEMRNRNFFRFHDWCVVHYPFSCSTCMPVRAIGKRDVGTSFKNSCRGRETCSLEHIWLRRKWNPFDDNGT